MTRKTGIVLIISLGSTEAAAENCSAMPEDGQRYTIVNYSSGMALDVEAQSALPGANVLSWSSKGSANQQFDLHKTGEGYWTIRAAHSGLNLDVLNFSQANGANIIQWEPTGTPNQQWLLKKSSLGAFNLVARHSGKSLTVASGEQGANIYQNTDRANKSQRWYFNPVNARCGETSDVNGFAAMKGKDGLNTTTGGGNANPILANSCDQLISAVSSDEKAVVLVPENTTLDCHTPRRPQAACAIQCPAYADNPDKIFYRIPVGNQRCSELGAANDKLTYRSRNDRRIHVGSNTSIVGLGAGSGISGASLILDNAQNIVIRNLTIEDVNPALVEAGDGISLANGSHVWLDHLRFRKISDGHVDMKNSQNITLSWNHFDGFNPAVCGSQHHYTNLVQQTQVTFHHNFWDKVSGRNPKLIDYRTRAHIFNNYWRNVTYFAVSADEGAQGKLEANYFENSAKPHWNNGSGYLDADIAGNRYTGISATDSYKDTGVWWVLSDTPMYRYTLDSVDSLPARLKAQSGPQ
ncbi:MAG: pectate lyase [Alteromonadaceae bacterium]|nr:pectate lyase [Alteromonadaceae bacterium]MBH86238.1 pectate lyase [Alteromonadaceae bacterium]